MRYKITTLKNTSLHHYTLWANSKEEACIKAQKQDKCPPLAIQEAPFFSFSPSPKEIFTALKQLHLMLVANYPLQECLLSLANHTPNHKLSSIFLNIANSLENGLSLHESFTPYEKVFGKLTIVMIEFGSRSGKLCECLELLIDELQDQENNKKEIKKALFYPIFVLICTIFCFSILIQMVVPQFIELFAQNQLPLPIYTKILIWIQRNIANYGNIILVFFAITISTLIVQFKNKGKLYQPILSTLLSLPFLGKILLHSYLYRYFFTLSILLQSGIDLLSSVSLAQESIQSQKIQNKLKIIQISLVNGKTLYDGLKESKLFDPLTLSLILVAQNSGRLDEILKTCAITYQTKNKDSLAFFISLIEPIFTLLLGIFVLFLALGIFTPIWNLQ